MATKEQLQQIEDFEICPKCFTTYNWEDFETVYERVPYGSSGASYPIDIGVKCHNCGYHEEI